METVRNILNSQVTTVAIGPTTAEALGEMGIKVDVVPSDYLFEKALSALAVYWNSR
jgi:uroporphyrinogen-III synthase